MYQRIQNLIEKNQRLIVATFFIVFFMISLFILQDYGLNWDEEAQWKVNGEIVFNYIFNDGKAALLDSNEKYHGPAFELVLIFIEKIMQLKDTRDVYLMRHTVTFLTFFCSVIVFYFLCKHCFKSWKLALLGCMFLVLSPRIFADSFYNSKDAVFLSLFIMGMYTLLLFHERQTYKRAVLYALTAAFTIDTRIMGIILPLISGAFIFLELLQNLVYKKKPILQVKSLLLFAGCLIVFVILFWPVLWEGPLVHFKRAFIEMSKYHWSGYVLYNGDYLHVTKLPWHYLPVWIAITTPIPYLLLFITGLWWMLKKAAAAPRDFIFHQRTQLLLLICFFLPLLMVILLKSVVYDGWRHVFFIYPSFIMIVVYGVNYLNMLLAGNGKKFLSVALILIIGFHLSAMIQLHPHQYVYFNALAGKDMKSVKEKYDLDYYGISSRQILEYLLKNDPSLKLTICAEKTPVILNTNYLPLEQRNRIRFTDMEYADYFICQYRFHKNDYDFSNEYFSVKVGNASIMSIFKLTDAERKRSDIHGPTHLKFFNDFENPSSTWSSRNIVQPATGAHSGKFAELTDSVNAYSDGLKFTVADSLCNRENLIIRASFWKYEDMGSESSMVVNIQNGETSYFWDGRSTQTLSGTKNKWDKVFLKIPLSQIKSSRDTVSVYLWNVGKKRIYMDDLTVELMEQKGAPYKIEYLK